MKYLSAASIALVVFITGCKVDINEPQAASPTAATATATSGATAPASTGATTTTHLTTAGKSDTTAKTPGKKPDATPDPLQKDKENPAYNASRIYQLFNLKTAPLTINGQTLTAWIADNDSLRQEGLMFVKDNEIKPDQAMIFVFPDAKEQGFWMHNTYIPLDIAYIGSDKVVVSTATMKALDETNVPSHGKAQYALEMKTGTLQRLGINKGTRVEIPDSVKSAPQAPPPGGGMSLGG